MHSKQETGIRVRIARTNADLSQDQVAAILGRERSGVSRIESGSLMLQVDDAVMIAEATGCSPAWLLLGDESASREGVETPVPHALSRILSDLRVAVADEVGFDVSLEQALLWVTKKAGIQASVFPKG
ncbi:helix-turn-helix transcriptional regulator [Agrobacterium rubi]|nr:helix-turn-helix transcriptional regulator [Agrobacterium rubi]NTF24330.1 helix-turn-helix transcriptional regulator [Agrobacterium rubi]